MPRRNRKGRAVVDGDQLAAAIGVQAPSWPSLTASFRAPDAAGAATGTAVTARPASAGS